MSMYASIMLRFVDKMMDAMPAEDLAEELVGVIHRTMDTERRERRKRELERDFDTNDEALLERYVQYSAANCAVTTK